MADFEKMKALLKKALDEMTPEDIEKYFPPDKTPKGWVSIEEHLPRFYACDILKGYSEFKIKFWDGRVSTSRVSDHNAWYYEVKEAGVTHWFND